MIVGVSKDFGSSLAGEYLFLGCVNLGKSLDQGLSLLGERIIEDLY